MNQNKLKLVILGLITVILTQFYINYQTQATLLKTNDILIEQNEGYRKGNIDLANQIDILQSKLNDMTLSKTPTSTNSNLSLSSSLNSLKGFELGINKGKLTGQLVTKEQIETGATIAERKVKARR